MLNSYIWNPRVYVSPCDFVVLYIVYIGARSQEPGVRSQESGARSQEPGVRSQKKKGFILILNSGSWMLKKSLISNIFG